MTKSVSVRSKKNQNDTYRVPCPFCKELIVAGAKKCRFCKESLNKVEEEKSQKTNFFTKKIMPSGPYKIWVLSMTLFLISIGLIQAKPESYWWIVMLASVAVGFIAFFTLVASIPGSNGKYGIITLSTFILFFGILINYDKVATAFGLEPSFTESGVRDENTVLEPANPTPTPTPTPTKTVNNPTKSNNTNTVQSNKIECTGPDGKKFNTTQKECDEFNAAWGNTATGRCLDPNGNVIADEKCPWLSENTSTINDNEYIKCNISTNCGGGYREMTKKSCDNITCCQLDDSWELRDKDQCKREQKQQSKAEWAKFCNDLYNPDTCSNYWQPSTTGLYDCRSDAYDNRISCYENYEE